MVKKVAAKKKAPIGEKQKKFNHSLKTVGTRKAKPAKTVKERIERGAKAPKPEDPKTGRIVEVGKKREKVTHRVTTHKGQGSTSMAVAPVTEESLPSTSGPIVVPEPDEAQRILKSLAELNDRAVSAKQVYESLKERTKTAKEKWEELAEEVQTKLRVATHGSNLPLFDAAEREADQSRMEQAAAPVTVEKVQEPAQSGAGAADAAGLLPEVVEEKDEPEPPADRAHDGLDEIADEQIPF